MRSIEIPDDIDRESVMAAMGDRWVIVNGLCEEMYPGLCKKAFESATEDIRDVLESLVKAGTVEKLKLFYIGGKKDSYHIRSNSTTQGPLMFFPGGRGE